MKRTALFVLLATAFVSTAPVIATAAPVSASQQLGTPSRLVFENSTRILSTLEARRAEFNKNRGALKQFVSGEFNQMFDRDYAARLVLGAHGRGASNADIAKFADALSENLMQRYGSSLLDFNTRLTVKMRSEASIANGRATKVSTQMLRQGGEPIPVDYLMHQVGGQWKVFDVLVEGVSFVQTFRSQFDGPLSRASIAQVAADLKAGKLQAQAKTQ
ncbi:MlaC/ttg2D family ABC transporter substrate-binding protein [Cognatilysobacter lacus]|uniref:ABC transporter substrate-binding protein n=1 Tax=Cognatilysobacter lacus TaxID=1643323 RepID=A0A5D8YVJ7_9GAMM|nr:ABC transporter substrate-binding protein [Lysobacter lacus]TZF86735.1 ABC transporter substrate-binding protein [Lysobacter lacus]